MGFKLKAVKKNKSYVVKSHMSNKAIKRETDKLINQIIKTQNPSEVKESVLAINLYNSMVWGIHNYYRHATHISLDCRKIARRVDTVLKNRMRNKLKCSGTLENGYIKGKYGMSKQIRFINNRPICPIGYVQTKNPLYKKKRICKYTYSLFAIVDGTCCNKYSDRHTIRIHGQMYFGVEPPFVRSIS